MSVKGEGTEDEGGDVRPKAEGSGNFDKNSSSGIGGH